MSVQRLGYLGFQVSDVAAWRSFATSRLGAMESHGDETAATFRTDSRSWRFKVEKGADDDLAFSGYEVHDAASLSAMKTRLETHGVVVKEESDELAVERGVLGLLSCKDPVGNRVEIYYGATEVFEKPLVSPAGVSGFKTGDQGFGHSVLFVPDIKAAMSFYVEAMGFHLSDIIDWTINPEVKVRVYFFHCNGRHHTLALAEAPGKRLHHFMLEVSSLDDVGLAYEKFEADGTVVMTLGRHTNDHMVSFYGATPSGFAVEFGWGARDVAPGWSVVRYDKISVWGHKFATPKP